MKSSHYDTKMTAIRPRSHKKRKIGALTVSVKGRGDEMDALSDSRTVPKCLIKTIAHFKLQKMGHSMEMTRQNQRVISYAPLYKCWCDVTMTRV